MHSARKRERNWVSWGFRQMVAAWLNWDGFFFLYAFSSRASMSVSREACCPWWWVDGLWMS